MALSCGILAYLTVAAFYDLRFRRIPNSLIVLGLISAVFVNIICRGPGGFLVFFLHITAAFLLLYPLFCLGVIGAGDIKLLLTVSAVLEHKIFIFFLCISFIFGALFSIVHIIRRRDFFARFFRLKEHFIGCVLAGKIKKYRPLSNENDCIHFAVCIAVGYLVTVILPRVSDVIYAGVGL